MVAIVSWLFALWTSYVFLNSLFYKFDTSALEPVHIFETIGIWMNDVLGTTIGGLFSSFGQYLIGGAELITSLVLLSPIVFWKVRRQLHFLGGIMAAIVMAGAVFFHYYTPLGWHPTWVVDNKDQCVGFFNSFNDIAGTCADTGLANAALSILVLGIIVAFLNKKSS